MTLTIGLTGGIGSGKSTATQYFAEFSAGIIDTDVIAKQLTNLRQPALKQIAEKFDRGLFYADGALNRSKMRALIFSDARAKQKLEAILHPLIKKEVQQMLASSTTPYQILIVPLLLETGDYRELISRVVVVDCDEETQRRHAMAHYGLSRAEVDAIMANQLPRAQRLQSADDILRNEADVDYLREQVASLHEKYYGMSGALSTTRALTHE